MESVGGWVEAGEERASELRDQVEEDRRMREAGGGVAGLRPAGGLATAVAVGMRSRDGERTCAYAFDW